jgi:hypothetical protein
MVKRKGTKALVAALLAVALVVPWQAANAASGATIVTINMPANVILSYQSALALTFTAGYDTQKDESAAGAASGTFALPTFNPAIATNAVFGAPTTLAVTVNNAWSVRGTGTITVSITCAFPCTATNLGSSATVSAMTVQTTAPAAGPASPISFAGGGMGVLQAIAGSINFNLDLSSVTLTGAHTGVVWTITATAA